MWVAYETSAWSPAQISLSLWQLLPQGILKIFKLCLIEHIASNQPTAWVFGAPWGLRACFRILTMALSISARRSFGQHLHDPSALCLQLLENRGLDSDQWLSLQRCWGGTSCFWTLGTHLLWWPDNFYCQHIKTSGLHTGIKNTQLGVVVQTYSPHPWSAKA